MQELERLTDINMWKTSKCDVALCHEVFDTIDEVLERVNQYINETNKDG